MTNTNIINTNTCDAHIMDYLEDALWIAENKLRKTTNEEEIARLSDEIAETAFLLYGDRLNAYINC